MKEHIETYISYPIVFFFFFVRIVFSTSKKKSWLEFNNIPLRNFDNSIGVVNRNQI